MSSAKLLTIGSRFFSNNGALPWTVSNQICDASNDGLGWVFQPYSADPITHLGFRYGARTGTPPTYVIGLEAVSTTTGVGDGTILGGGSPASVSFRPPADTTWDGLWKWQALANAYTPARGDFLFSSLRYDSAAANTVDGSNNSSFTSGVSGGPSGAAFMNYPPAVTLTAGSWTKSVNMPVFGWRTASGRFGYIHQSDYSTAVSTTGHRQAMRFTLPSTHGSTFEVLGVRTSFQMVDAGTFSFGLWSGATLLQSTTYDTDYLRLTNVKRPSEFLFSDTTLATLSYGTEYRIGFEVLSNADFQIAGRKLAEAEDREAYPYGDVRGLSTFDGSTWTDDNTVLPEIDLILNDITVPSGGGGALYIGSRRNTLIGR